MVLLGISAYYHDSAAALIQDGKIIAAVQEERFSRKKNDNSFPINSCIYCLEQAKLKLSDVDKIVFYEKPFLKFERIMDTHLNNVPNGLISFVSSIPDWISKKIYFKRLLFKELKLIDVSITKEIKERFQFVEHHLSHAAAVFFTSNYLESAILTIDGVGEHATTSIFKGEGNNIELIKEIHFPDSIGLLYSAFTYFLGFKVNSGEYKLMGLAPYGDPKNPETSKYIDLIRNKLVRINQDGSVKLNMKYFGFTRRMKMIEVRKWEKLFELKKREPESKILQKHCNLAWAIQNITEDIIYLLAVTAQKVTNSENLCIAGGVALNCVANGKLLEKLKTNNIYIQPASGDAGGALGAILASYFIGTGNERNINMKFDPFLGPSYFNVKPESLLKGNNSINYTSYANEKELVDRISDLILEGKIVGWFQGRMEYGPRALGNRSILADARHQKIHSFINEKIKKRENFRPFAPSVLEEDVSSIFNFETVSPYMLFTGTVREGYRKKISGNNYDLPILERFEIERSSFPAITHVDYSSRIQTVDANLNPLYYKLLSKIKEKTGFGIVLNTSLNIRGEPMVCSPFEAISCFKNTHMDYLVINDYLFERS
ncbi:carbamoyltransferase family protein [Draconibacterium mangrovi]|uniref:carbamoyltransferase family protein n=1 Tax=Draconibacterium mangrovi TaxID=2697469 RepID=UPI0013D68E60|nr:carbamoyltransferase [Draconibacterium mangrovi]